MFFPVVEALAATIVSSLEVDAPYLRLWVAMLPEQFQKVLTNLVSEQLGAPDDRTPPDLVKYQIMKARFNNIMEMLWEVSITVVTKDGYHMPIKRLVSAQPDPVIKGRWHIRLPNWNVITFTPDFHMDPMHRLVTKTAMKELFTLQRQLLHAELRWKGLADAMDWQQAMVSQMLLPHGDIISMRHEQFDEVQKAFYELEDPRTRRKDYRWDDPKDPMDKHRKGKQTRKQLSEGDIPIDIGPIDLGADELTGSQDEMDEDRAFLADMVRHGEAELINVGHPHMFSTMKRLRTIFTKCSMTEDVFNQFAKRLADTPYWKVKDKNKERWYIYSYDWREGKKFTWCVIPIGHVEKARAHKGMHFVMYSEDTLFKMKKQSLYIADYRVKVTKRICKRLDLKFEFIGEYLEFSVYNDWAMSRHRHLQLPHPAPAFTREQLRGVPVYLPRLIPAQARN